MFDHDVRDRGKGEDDWRARLQRSQGSAVAQQADAEQDREQDREPGRRDGRSRQG